jgi:DNA-binding beta-propeller fold protein YncE
MIRSTRLPLSIACLGWLVAAYGASQAAETSVRLRRPVALQLSGDEQQLFVANSRSGSLSVVDLAAGAVGGEWDIGKCLSDLKRVPGGNRLLITDEAAHQLLLADAASGQVTIAQRIPVAQYPVSVVVSRDGRFATVASLWSHRVTFVELPADHRVPARVTATVDLPFAPRCQVLVSDDARLIVSDAFSNRLAVVDTAKRGLLHVRNFPSHNIRGMGISPDGRKLLVVHQMLNELAHTTSNDVHWGLLMSNDLRWLPLASVLSPTADLYHGAHMHPLGSAGSATGDPSGLAVTASGRVVVTLGGVGEVAVGTESDFSLQRVEVGRRPTAVVVDQAGVRAFVTNTLADSVSIVQLGQRDATRQIPLGPLPELTLRDRGELLFYDATLSHDGWMSCHSCHADGHANSLLNDNFSDGSFGAPKRVLSLLGATDTAPYAWNGGVASLQEQIHKSIENTMQGDETPTQRQLDALVAFVETLKAPPPLDLARGVRDEAAVLRGERKFLSLGCAGCHAPPTFTTPHAYDVGIHDRLGNTEFNPPSLRGVSQRGPYFHDNRAESLEAVFRNEAHQLERYLKDDELRDLIAFLQSL